MLNVSNVHVNLAMMNIDMNINDADFQNAVYETVYNMTSLIWLIYNTYGSESIGSFHFEMIISS